MPEIKPYIQLFRPVTLLAPAIGGVFFGLMGIKAAGISFVTAFPLLILSGLILAMANASSNILNQVFDAEIDMAHPEKRKRPIPSGKVDKEKAMSLAVFLMIIVIASSLIFFGFTYGLTLTIIMLFAWMYNCPPLRLKTRLFWSNVAIAAPRGGMGITCAYSAFASPYDPVIYVAIIYFALYVFGTNTLKDFADEEYDRASGVRNFVTVWGKEKASLIVGTFTVIPFIALIVVEDFDFLHLNSVTYLPLILSILMIYLLFKGKERKSVEGNSTLWVIFYLQFSLMMITFALPFIFGG